MKTANSALQALLAQDEFIYADLWTFALRSGVTKYYADFSLDLTVGGNTFTSQAVCLTGAKYKVQRGLQVDEDDVTLAPIYGSTESVNGVGILQAIREGAFDRAVVTHQRQFMPMYTNPAQPNLSANPLTLFVGEVSDSDVTRVQANIKIKSMLNLLNIYMPRRQYQPTCSWVFGDSNCTFARSGVTSSSSVGSSSTGSTIICGLSQGAGYFNNGVVKMTSGANSGLSRSVKTYSPGNITLVAPFPNPPQVGDTFNIMPGCSKNFAGPTSEFNATAQAGSTNSVIYCGINQAAGYFNGGTIQGTSGANVGQTRTINSWLQGVAYLSSAFPNNPAVNDEFALTAVSTNTQGSCTGYSNTAHFGGMPFIPVPETAL